MSQFHQKALVMGRLVHTGLGSSSLVSHVLHYPPPPHANSFVIGTAVINTLVMDSAGNLFIA